MTTTSNHITRLLSILLLAVLFSCTKDKGNYEYKELNEVKIKGLSAELATMSLDKLVINPQLEDKFDETKYRFEWKAIQKTGDNVSTILATTKNLDYEVTLLPGAYTLVYTITDPGTNFFWQHTSNLQVNTFTTEGWMVLCSENGKTRLDMVSTVTDGTYHDVLKGSNIPDMNGPRKIEYLNATLTDAYSPIYLFTDDGATRLGKNGFEWKQEFNMVYEMGNGKPVTPYSLTTSGLSKMFVSGTEAYFCDNMMGDGLYGTAKNKTYAVAPGIGSNMNEQIYFPMFLMYDTDNKRFMTYSAGLSMFGLANDQDLNDMEAILGDGVSGNAFSEFPYGYDYVYMENTKYAPGNNDMGITYTILANGAKKYLYGIQMGDIFYSEMGSPYALGKAYYGDLSACTNINQATAYAFSSLRDYMYYAVNDVVYRVDLSQPTLSATQHLKLTGETITCLKFNLYKNLSYANRNYDLIVGSKKGNGNNAGVLRIYEGFTSSGNFSNVTPKMYEGFADIVDVTFSEKEDLR